MSRIARLPAFYPYCVAIRGFPKFSTRSARLLARASRMRARVFPVTLLYCYRSMLKKVCNTLKLKNYWDKKSIISMMVSDNFYDGQ